jgi:mannitol 2-dehydrogenase
MVQPIELNRVNLTRLQPPVQVPLFDPATVSAGIVHLGLGGFHRAHMARYTHNLMEMRADAMGWGIIGAGLMPTDRRMQESLGPQDNLYTLVERSATQATVSVIGSLADVVFAGDSSAALLDAIDHPQIRIVSLTVTEHGYCLNRSTKRLDPDHPLIRQDLAHPDRPSSAIGIIVEAYRRRQQSGTVPFTALSCDNIQHNGSVLREAVLALAALRDANLTAWIAENASFPSTMVDRITPVTAKKDVAALAERYGIIDRWPVFAEAFTQWVIEDRFPQGRPAWEDVGAQFVNDVAPYEFMKLRLLNTSHLVAKPNLRYPLFRELICRYTKRPWLSVSLIQPSRTPSSGSTRMRRSTFS